MASGIFVNDSGRILVSLFFWIGKRVTTLLPIFFYHKLAQSLLTMGLGRVVTPPALFGNVFARSPARSGLILIGLTQTLLDARRCSETEFFLRKLHKETRFLP